MPSNKWIKATPRMGRIIEEALEKGGLSIADSDSYLVYEMDSKAFMPLTISVMEHNTLVVYHHYIQNGDVMFDPEIAFWRDEKDGQWYPYGYRQSALPMPYRPYVEFDENFRPARANVRMQRDCALFCESPWAGNLKDYLKEGQIVKIRGGNGWIEDEDPAQGSNVAKIRYYTEGKGLKVAEVEHIGLDCVRIAGGSLVMFANIHAYLPRPETPEPVIEVTEAVMEAVKSVLKAEDIADFM
jgi:hypothetical protein